MKLTVKNLGAVSHAEIDLNKSLLIFTGENNSGKTYITNIIHGLYDLKHIAWNQFNEKGEKIELNYDYPDDSDSEKGTYQTTIDIIAEQTVFYKEISKILLENLSQIFAVQPSFFKETLITLDKAQEDEISLFSKKIDLSFGNIEVSKRTKSKQINISDRTNELTKDQLDNLFFDILVGETSVWGFTDIRGAINIFSRELSLTRSRIFSGLIGNNARTKELIEIVTDRVNRYSMPVREGLKIAEGYDIYQNKESKFSFLADILESLFFKGKISVTESGRGVVPI